MRSTFFFILVFLPGLFYGQDAALRVWTLDHCIDHAVSNNFNMQQFGLQKEKTRIQTNSAKNLFLPFVDGRVRNVHNWGLFIDPSTNILTTQNNEIYAGSVEAQLDLFNGGLYYYTVKQNQELYNAAVDNQETIKNEITLMVIAAYYQMLYANEQLNISNEQKAQIERQYRLIQGMVESVVLHKREMLLMESEIALKEVAITDAKNIYLRANLLLRQAMGITEKIELNIDTTMKLSMPTDSLNVTHYDSICNKASYFLPEIASAKKTLNAMRYKMKMAQALLYPSFSVSGGVITKSSSLIQMEQSNQFKQNLSQYVAFNLAVPLFNRFQTRNNISLARIDVMIQEKEVKKRNQEVEIKVQSAYLDLVASHKKYWAVNKQVEALKSQFVLAEKSYAAGILNHTEFSYTNNLYTNAQLLFLQSKYDYFYKREVLSFYEGKKFCSR